MEFSVNHPILYVLVGIIIAVVLAQSIYFLARALRRAKQKGIDPKIIKSTISSAAIFTIAPVSIAIIAKEGLPSARIILLVTLSNK